MPKPCRKPGADSARLDIPSNPPESCGIVPPCGDLLNLLTVKRTGDTGALTTNGPNLPPGDHAPKLPDGYPRPVCRLLRCESCFHLCHEATVLTERTQEQNPQKGTAMHSQIPRTELKSRRMARGMTALQLALAAGSNETRIFALERGRCNPSHVEAEAIGRALGVKPETVFPELSQRAAR